MSSRRDHGRERDRERERERRKSVSRSRSRSRSPRRDRSRSRSAERYRRQRHQRRRSASRSRSRSRSRSPQRDRRSHHRRSRSRSPRRSRSRSRSRDRPSRSYSSSRHGRDSHSSRHRDEEDRIKKEPGIKKEPEQEWDSHSKTISSASEATIKSEKELKKEKKKRKQQLQEEILGGYTNDSNPFGDSNLAERFVWRLKKRAEGRSSKDDSDDEESEQRRILERKMEIEKVKRRREEREIEKQLWEEQRMKEAREKEAESYGDWERKELEFHLQQAKNRSEIRIREGRPKPIDILYKSLNMDILHGGFDPADESGLNYLDFDMHEPDLIFQDLTLQEMLELREDIEMYLELDTSEHRGLWSAMLLVCDDELVAAKQREGVYDPDQQPNDGGVHKSVMEDIIKTFQGKSFAELTTLQEKIQLKINQRNAGVDVNFWELVLKRLMVHKAKAKLRETHAELLKKRLEILEQRHSDKLKEISEAKATTSASSSSTSVQSQALAIKEEEPQSAGTLPAKADSSEIERLRRQRLEMLERNAKKLQERQVEKQMSDEEMYLREMELGMEENEEAFNTNVPLENKVYSWHDKYRPRQPRYFNRVHTGFEWNKYNQTHYDHDNPPPKVVQGYKFNIFYPDLIDKTKAPQYFLEDSDSPDTKILRFHAGPPYEDIAFKIVNKEWEYSHKKGFKCTFERGILHLWFNFKRFRYRR